jgi:hypothetical protein
MLTQRSRTSKFRQSTQRLYADRTARWAHCGRDRAPNPGLVVEPRGQGPGLHPVRDRIEQRHAVFDADRHPGCPACVGPSKTAVGQQFVEIVNSGSVDAPEDCVVFNAHIGGEEVGPEAELRFVRSADNSEGPTLVPSGYRLRAGQFEVWAPPAQTGTTPLDDTERANYQGFGKCGLATLATPGSDGINWWTPLLVNGDRGIFLDSFAVTTLNPVDATIGSKCLSLEQDPTTGAFIEDYPTVANDRCLDDDRNKVEVLTLFFELAGRVRVVNLDRPFVFADSVKVRNDWVIGDF